MRGQIRGLAQAENNASNGISLIQTAEGGLNETHAILQRMRELAVQSSNGTYDDEVDRANISKEVDALKSEMDRIASSTHYNGINLLDGSMGSEKAATVGDIASAAMSFTETATIGSFADASVVGADATLIKGQDNNMYLQVGDKTYKADAAGTKFLDSEGKTFLEVSAKLDNADTKVGDVLKFTIGAASTTLGAAKNASFSSKSSELIFQIGANGSLDQRVGLHVDNMSSGNLGLDAPADAGKPSTIFDIDVSTRAEANDAIKVIDAATNQVSGTRADLGALQNRLEHTLNNLGVTKENLQAAESSIRDVDMAKEMMEFTKNNILVQASQAMLAQANQLPQGVLQLLR
jgi:flagellin